MVIILIGPSGCGKTTVGLLLAKKLAWNFYDADNFHSPQNVEKMRSGIPLSDRDREPWLLDLASQIENWNQSGANSILACSALKSEYRKMLWVDQKTVFTVYLKGDISLLADRMQKRTGHYMKFDLLQSQVNTFEEPEDGFTVHIDQTPEQIVENIISLFSFNLKVTIRSRTEGVKASA